MARSKTNILKLVFGDGDWKAEANVGKYLLAVLFFPFLALFHFILFLLFSWSISRRGKCFVYGFPALLTVTCMLVALALFSFFKDKVRNRYVGGFAIAFKERLLEDAKLFNMKARTLDPEFEPGKIHTAELAALDEERGYKVAFPIMKQLAPLDDLSIDADGRRVVDEDVNLDAHIWCAKTLLSREIDLEYPEEVRHEMAKSHLEIVTEGLKLEEYQIKLLSAGENQGFDGEGRQVNLLFIESHYLLGLELDRNNKQQEAIEHWILACQKAPWLFPVPLEKLKELHGPESRTFRTACDKAVNQLSRWAVATPNNIEIWKALVKCYELKGEFAQAQSQIRSAQKMVTDIRVARQLRLVESNLFVNAVDNVKDRGSEKGVFDAKIGFLTRALKIMPQNLEAIKRVVKIVYKPDGPLSEDETDWLRLVALNNETKFVAYTMLGLSSATQVNAGSNSLAKEEAIVQWSHALTENRGAVDVINFAAQLIGIDADDEDGLETAMTILNLALEMAPSEPKFLETRGVLMLKEKRYTRAYDDLYTAYEIPNKTPSPTLLQALIQCVEQMDSEEKKADLEVFKQRLELLKKQYIEQRRSL